MGCVGYIYAGMTQPTFDLDNYAPLHNMLSGQEIDYVVTNGTCLVIRTTTGKEVHVAWVNDNGEPISGKPAIRFAGVNIHAKTAKMFG